VTIGAHYSGASVSTGPPASLTERKQQRDGSILTGDGSTTGGRLAVVRRDRQARGERVNHDLCSGRIRQKAPIRMIGIISFTDGHCSRT